MARLEGKVAFITGAGSGIARAAARLFAREGARVGIAELKPELGRSSEQLVRDSGGEAVFIETDVTKEDSVRNSIQQTSSSLANSTFCTTAPVVRSWRINR
jgi:NAD(P)-dependent dehydrogenase (short-subunit alcohol dehydrogenase family)